MAPDYSVIGKRIKEARNNQNLTQEELADELNISVAFLSRVETGKSHINLKRLTQIAEFLKAEGCDEIQGFLYYRPMCQKDFETLLHI